MRHLSSLCAVCLLIVPSVAIAQQISPNPNPVGNNITVDTAGATNDANPFKNNESIDIANGGTLTKKTAR
ncbi:MAG: hypothetical protein ABGX16_14535 [Pirellulales bacterium]